MTIPTLLAAEIEALERLAITATLYDGGGELSDLSERLADAIATLRRERDEAVKALAQATQEEFSMAWRIRAAVVEARRRLAKGRSLWNGPCHECDAVLAEALSVDCPTTDQRIEAAERERDDLIEHCDLRDQQMAAVKLERDRYKAALEDIARQQLTGETKGEDIGCIEDGYDECIRTARRALPAPSLPEEPQSAEAQEPQPIHAGGSTAGNG